MSFVNVLPTLVKVIVDLRKMLQSTKEKAAREERDKVRDDHNNNADKWQDRAAQDDKTT